MKVRRKKSFVIKTIIILLVLFILLWIAITHWAILDKRSDAGRRLYEVTNIQKAAMKGDTMALIEFLKQGVDINARDEIHRTALDYAAFGRNEIITNILIARGAKISLFNAIEMGDISKVKELIDKGANVNERYCKSGISATWNGNILQ